MSVMSVAPEHLLEQALSLSVPDRARLASGLLSSLDEDHTDEDLIERHWSAESERRAEQVMTGDVTPTSWEHLVDRIETLRPRPPA